MQRKKARVQRKGFNPRSLENLNRSGRQVFYDEAKKSHNIYLSITAMEGLEKVAADTQCPSISELVEQLGRGYLEATTSPSNAEVVESGDKTRHAITVTPTAWNNLKDLVSLSGARSVSDWLERLGTGKLEVKVLTDDQPALVS